MKINTPNSLARSCSPFMGLMFTLELIALVNAWQLVITFHALLSPVLEPNLTPAGILRPWLRNSTTYCLFALAAFRAYRFGRSGATLTFRSIRECAIVTGILAAVAMWLSPDVVPGLARSFLILFIPAVVLALLGMRFTAAALAALVEKYLKPERVAIVGGLTQSRHIVAELRVNDQYSFRGVIVPVEHAATCCRNGLRVLGTVKQLAEVINRERLDRIVLLDGHSQRIAGECARVSKRMGVTVSRPIALSDPDMEIAVVRFAGMQLLEMKPIYVNQRQELIKRVFDTMVSSLSIALLSPLIAVLAVLVKVSSPGPALFISARVGRGGRYFDFLKFRTMYVGSEDRANLEALNEKSGHLFKMRNDPRVTPIGRFMRRYSLDELPQLFNVLRGEMSLVGPRPLPAKDLDPDGQSGAFGVWAENRSRVMPGITGLWQIRGRSDLPFETMMDLDITYIRDWSLKLDWTILLATPMVVLMGRGAY